MNTERADAARNRIALIATAREMLTDVGIDKITMDALAERSGLGKGTVFRRFGTRSGIFMALLGEGERDFQERVQSGPPPLGPGAEPLDRLIAFGRARLRFLQENRDIARAAFDGRATVPFGPPTTMTQRHVRMLLHHMGIGGGDLDILAMQLTAALDVPPLLYTPPDDGARNEQAFEDRLARGWEDLVRRLIG
ncbi:TetR/AcrR family transcriptional regulator [Microbacterium ulmi]|uniref:TetR/AcrR family transcriptional regulator n=1 Tax=Microbacterium ulmi TaxID=179095 RepID=A0A7Y2Q174_9MICO|nr:TetR/AcrR family transcriptional regulator [Microbacterium ulmi]NII69340.1 polyketide synthase 12 [Microbacterium ulmi]NNH04047.1 TetR/AcrR family transcriptional regulator [Microbacterium ulmi]